GNYLYSADDGDGMRIFSLSNPASPALTGQFALPTAGFIRSLTIAGNYAYLADGFGIMRIVNVSNAAAPQEVGSFTAGGNPWHITNNADRAYFGTDEIMPIDISHKSKTALLSAYDTPDEARHSPQAKDLVDVSNWAGGVNILGATEQIYLPLIANP